jgi:hypothetical protein
MSAIVLLVVAELGRVFIPVCPTDQNSNSLMPMIASPAAIAVSPQIATLLQ